MLATVFFALALCHTFLVKFFYKASLSFPSRSQMRMFFHLLSEVEFVLGFWGVLYLFALLIARGPAETWSYVTSLRFYEPLFVGVVMLISSIPVVIYSVRQGLRALTRTLVGDSTRFRSLAFYWITLSICPLLGSLISEPAAMTVTAWVLKEEFFDEEISSRFKYITLAILFINVSIGGVLTHFAAPPVIMIAHAWNWNTPYLFFNFGWKASLAIMTNTSIAAFFLHKELLKIRRLPKMRHTDISKTVKIREGFLIAFFLSGLIVLGKPQSWWLSPLLSSLTSDSLFLAATLLTAFTDNAALTYLGSQVPSLAEPLKYALLAGAVSGGGLTLIANAPNPAGYAVLKDSFGKEGVSFLRLFGTALPFTVLTMGYFYFL